LTEKYSLLPHLVFNREVIAADWDSGAQLYHITTKDVKTGELSLTTAEILISAVGALDVPKFPDIQGLKDFGGTMFHSSRWVHTELEGKRVAVIGNGASAWVISGLSFKGGADCDLSTQIIPMIAQKPNIQVTQLCRTPNYLHPPVIMFEFIISTLSWLMTASNLVFASDDMGFQILAFFPPHLPLLYIPRGLIGHLLLQPVLTARDSWRCYISPSSEAPSSHVASLKRCGFSFSFIPSSAHGRSTLAHKNPHVETCSGEIPRADHSELLSVPRAAGWKAGRLMLFPPAVGCKRILLDAGYLSALHRDNVTVNWEGISSIVKDGIITRTGKVVWYCMFDIHWCACAGEHLNFDVIILASGFVTVRLHRTAL
jgi:L-lysine 6-monooxygenase (NADPH-requiring)